MEPKRYIPLVHYTRKQLEDFLVRDLLNDAEQSEKQAETGPFFPERGITKESLLDYAAECRKQAKTPARTLSKINLQFFTPGRDCVPRFGLGAKEKASA